MRLEETLLSKKIIIETEDPYGLAMGLMDIVSSFGRIVEHENKYETNGPTRRTVLNFDIIENVDRVSQLIIEFGTQGETNNINYLEIEVSGKFIADIESSGFFTSAFCEHYLKHTFPRQLKAADEKLKALDKKISEFAEAAGPKRILRRT